MSHHDPKDNIVVGKPEINPTEVEKGDMKGLDESREVFQKTTEGVDFRTVGWPRACLIFLKGI